MRETSAPDLLRRSGGNAAPAGPRRTRALDARGPEAALDGGPALAQPREAGERRIPGAAQGARPAQSWLGFRLFAPRGRLGAVADPEGVLDYREIRIGRRQSWRPGGLLQGSLRPATFVPRRGNRDRGLRGEGALLRPGDQATQVRQRRAADAATRQPAGELVEELLRQLDWQAGELLLGGSGLWRREPGRVFERCRIGCRTLARVPQAPGIASAATAILVITNISITATPSVGLQAALRLVAATGAGSSGGYLVY